MASSHVFREDEGGLRFVGDFEALYQDELDPWEQSADHGEMARYYEHSRSRLVDALGDLLNPGARGLEVGCGCGTLTQRLNVYFRVTGMDISPTAVARAKARNGGTYVQGDILADRFDKFGPFRFVLWGQILWYVLHDIDRAVKNTLHCIEPGGFFVLSQAFLREQHYGRDIADGFVGTLRLFLDRYSHDLTLVYARYDEDARYIHDDGLMIFRRVDRNAQRGNGL